jgi:hypothetical protein
MVAGETAEAREAERLAVQAVDDMMKSVPVGELFDIGVTRACAT